MKTLLVLLTSVMLFEAVRAADALRDHDGTVQLADQASVDS
jgi:hypothetical protein